VGDPGGHGGHGSERQRRASFRACASRERWPPSASPLKGYRYGRPKGGASSPVCRDLSDSGLSSRPPGGRNARRVERGPRPVDPAGFAQAVEQCSVKPLPHPGFVPLLQAPPAGHAAAAAHLLGEHLPGDARLEHEQNTRKSGAIVHARAPTFGFRRLLRQEWFDYDPKFVGYEWFRHGHRILDHGFC
jgi:hypothetical protein